MNKWDKIELTSNITEDPNFDKADALMEPTPKRPDQQPQALHDHPYEEKELEAVMGPEGGGGWYWGQDWNQPLVFEQDDPMEVLSKVQLAKIGEKTMAGRRHQTGGDSRATSRRNKRVRSDSSRTKRCPKQHW